MHKHRFPLFVGITAICISFTVGQLAAQQTTRPGSQTTRPGTQASQAAAPAATPPKVENADTSAPQDATESQTSVGIGLALTLYRQGDFEQAKQVLEEICKNDKSLPPACIFLAQFAANSQQGNRVRYWLDQATWEMPDDAEAFVLLAEIAINDNRFAEAKLLVEKGISLLDNLSVNDERRKSVEVLAESVQGMVAIMRSDWKTAQSHYEKLIAIDPTNQDYFEQLALIAAQQGLFDDAVAHYEKAIANGSKLPTPKLIVSQIADQQGKTEIADKFFADVMKATSIDAESLRLAVQIQLRRNKIEDAEKFLAQAIKAEPNHFDNQLLAGTIAMFKKDFSAAEKRFQEAILINPENYGAAQGLALALAEQNDSLKKDRALFYAKSNVQRYGESSDAVATLAWVFFKSDKQVEAEYLVNVVVASGDLTPINAYFLAEIVAAADQKEKALALVKIALGSKIHFVKKTEAEALQKKLEGELDKDTAQPATTPSAATPPPSTLQPTTTQPATTQPSSTRPPATSNTGTTTPPVRIQGTGTRN